MGVDWDEWIDLVVNTIMLAVAVAIVWWLSE